MIKPPRRLILIMPPQHGLLDGFASGLISLSNYVQTRCPDIAVTIEDLSIQPQESIPDLLRHMLQSNGEVQTFVGITTTTASYQSALRVAALVKHIDAHVIVIMGGHHVGADPETVLRCHHEVVNLVVKGEGERTLCDVLHQFPDLNRVPGVAFITPAGDFVQNAAPIPLTQDELDSIQVSMQDREMIGTPGKFDHATYVSARGCPLACAFCAVGNDRIRAKSTRAVVRDIETLISMGFTRLAIEDNFFAHSPSRTREVCEALSGIRQRHPMFTWDCQTRVESLARSETLDLLIKAGCEAVYIGVESLHPDQLAYLNKTRDPVRYLRTLTDTVVPMLLETDIACYLNLQFGLPGETKAHGRATCDMLGALGKQAVLRGKKITIFPQLHVVYPGTGHFEQGVTQGRFPMNVFEAFTKWESEQSPVLYWLGEHFAHGTGGIPEGILNPHVLRSGHFEGAHGGVDVDAILRISGALREINRLPGVCTFNYGKYIVPSTNSAGLPAYNDRSAVFDKERGV